jgi:membrane-bound metal-dependent hydrolase YbcI (DUF457 family)
MSVAYLLGKGAGSALSVKINIPLIMVLSIIPDIDIIYDYFTHSNIHRGPTHSIIFAVLIFIPFFLVYRKKALPYFLALISHSIGDFFIGGQLELLWPFSTQLFGFHELGFYYIDILNPANVAFELSIFLVAIVVLYKSGDWKFFFSSKKTNLLLIIPVATVLLPSTVGYPLSQPLLFTQPILALAHIFYFILFFIAIFKTLAFMLSLFFKIIQPTKSKEPP